MTTIAIDRVFQSFSGAPALDGVSLTVERGAVGLLGVNGAGKTTLLSAAAGARKPSSGSVQINGVDLYGRGGRTARHLVALVPQHLDIPPRMTAFEAVTHLTWMRGVAWKSASTSALDALEQVGLVDRAYDAVHRLSGGMRRRIALAQALASNAEVLLLDEPTTGLDPQQRHDMLTLVGNLGRTVVISSHIVEDIEALCERILVLHRGKILFDGDLTHLRSLGGESTSERALEAAFLRQIKGADAPW